MTNDLHDVQVDLRIDDAAVLWDYISALVTDREGEAFFFQRVSTSGLYTVDPKCDYNL